MLFISTHSACARKRNLRAWATRGQENTGLSILPKAKSRSSLLSFNRACTSSIQFLRRKRKFDSETVLTRSLFCYPPFLVSSPVISVVDFTLHSYSLHALSELVRKLSLILPLKRGWRKWYVGKEVETWHEEFFFVSPHRFLPSSRSWNKGGTTIACTVRLRVVQEYQWPEEITQKEGKNSRGSCSGLWVPRAMWRSALSRVSIDHATRLRSKATPSHNILTYYSKFNHLYLVFIAIRIKRTGIASTGCRYVRNWQEKSCHFWKKWSKYSKFFEFLFEHRNTTGVTKKRHTMKSRASIGFQRHARIEGYLLEKPSKKRVPITVRNWQLPERITCFFPLDSWRLVYSVTQFLRRGFSARFLSNTSRS